MPDGCSLPDRDANGAVAQLGERIVRNDEVRGSIPLSSTIRVRNLVVTEPVFPQFSARRTLSGPEETTRLGARLAAILRAGDCLCLSGDLGAGKSVLARGLIQALSGEADIPSPTFTLVQTYHFGPGHPDCGKEIWHVDLYRLDSGAPAQWEELGLAEAFGTALVIVEWPERLGSLRPAGSGDIHLTFGVREETRIAQIQTSGEMAVRWTDFFC